MSKLIKVFKISLKMNFSILNIKKKKSVDINKILMLLAALLGIVYIMSIYVESLNKVYDFVQMYNEEDCIIPIIFFASQQLILIFGVFYIFTVFYYSKDYEALVYLPFKPSIILGSKFMIVVLYEYITSFIALAPCIYVYGVRSGQNILFWLKSIAVFLVNPIIPVVIVALIVSICMKIFENRRHKDKIGAVLSIAIIISMILIFMKLEGNRSSFLAATNLQETLNGFIKNISDSFINVRWITETLMNNSYIGVISLIKLILGSVLSFVIFSVFVNKIFDEGIFIHQNRVSVNYTVGDIIFKKKKLIMSFFLKELKIFFRNSVYIINGMFGIVLAPFLTILMVNISGNDVDSITQLKILMENSDFSKEFTLIIIGVLLITCGINIVAASAISREGKEFWICRVLPVDYKTQIYAKLLFSLFIAVSGILLNSIVYLVVFKLSVVRILISFLIAVIISIQLAALGLIVDLSKPKLEWINPAEAIKQNLNVVITMVASIVVVFLYFMLIQEMLMNNINEFLIYLIIIVISLIVSFLLFKLMNNLSKKLFLNE